MKKEKHGNIISQSRSKFQSSQTTELSNLRDLWHQLRHYIFWLRLKNAISNYQLTNCLDLLEAEGFTGDKALQALASFQVQGGVS